MLSYNEFIEELTEESVEDLAESYTNLVEKLITFGGKPYPRFGNVVIMAGGAGSGKGFIKDKLMGIDGKVFDVDELKILALKTPKIIERVKKEFGTDLTQMDLRDPSNTGKLHEIIGDVMKMPKKRKFTFFSSILTTPEDRKPNLIFDVTLKDTTKFESITRNVTSLGYNPKNIHIVWVINDVEVAKDQNSRRARRVSVETVVGTHRRASQTMREIIDMGESITRHMDGDIIFVFNKVGVDSPIKKSSKGGMVITDADYFYAKRAGQPIIPVAEMDEEIRAKITSYVPKNVDWMS